MSRRAAASTMSTVRMATMHDIADLVDMARDYWASSRQMSRFDEAGSKRWFIEQIEKPTNIVLRSDRGVFVGCVIQLPFEDAKRANEVWWFAQDGSGKKLVSWFEHWAAMHGANIVTLSWRVLADPKREGIMRNMITGLGYEIDEIVAVKRLAS